MGVSLRRGPLGEPGEGVHLQGTVRDRGLWKWSISLYRSSVRGTCRRARRLWRWSSLSMGASVGNLGEDSYAGDLCVEEGSGIGVSLYRGPIGEPGEGGPSTRNFKN